MQDLTPTFLCDNFVICRGIKQYPFANLDGTVWLFPREANVGDIVFYAILDPHGPASGVPFSDVIMEDLTPNPWHHGPRCLQDNTLLPLL